MIIRREEITKLTGLSWSTIMRMVKDGEFPPPVKLNKRSVGWRMVDVEAWEKELEYKKLKGGK